MPDVTPEEWRDVVLHGSAWTDEQGRPLPTFPCPKCGRRCIDFRITGAMEDGVGFAVEALREARQCYAFGRRDIDDAFECNGWKAVTPSGYVDVVIRKGTP